MKNATELRNELATIFNALKNGDITNKDAAEFSNLAGKMINSAKVQVEYYSLTDETAKIAFLEEPKDE